MVSGGGQGTRAYLGRRATELLQLGHLEAVDARQAQMGEERQLIEQLGDRLDSDLLAVGKVDTLKGGAAFAKRENAFIGHIGHLTG